MRLLICTTEYPPEASGIGNVVKHVSDILKKRGNKCYICSPMGPDIRLGNSNFVRKFGGFGLLHFWIKVQRYFEKVDLNYDVVWLHNPVFLWNSPFPSAVVTLHGTYQGFNTPVQRKSSFPFSQKTYYRLMMVVERHSLAKLANNEKVMFTAVGSTIIKELHSFGISNVLQIPNGVDAKWFRKTDKKDLLRDQFDIPRDASVFVSLGRLTEIKNPFRTIDLFEEIEAANRKSVLVFVGKGHLLKKVMDYTKKKGLEKVHFVGHLVGERLSAIVSCADFYLSTSGYEGGQPPLAMLETMACGLVPIVPNFLNNIIAEAKCGIAYNSSNDILGFLDRIKYDDQSRLAREYAKNHDWAKICDRYTALFATQGIFSGRGQCFC